jgi:hypothetical protein
MKDHSILIGNEERNFLELQCQRMKYRHKGKTIRHFYLSFDLT